MWVFLNSTSGKAVYRQIVDYVKTAAAAGVLKAGDRLPSVRLLSQELHVNRNTIAKAYAELQNQGVIDTLAGKGCFVRANSSLVRKGIRLKVLTEAIDDAIVRSYHLQISQSEFQRLVAERFAVLEHHVSGHATRSVSADSKTAIRRR